MIELEGAVERGRRLHGLAELVGRPPDVQVVLGAVGVDPHGDLEVADRLREVLTLHQQGAAEEVVRLGGVGAGLAHLLEDLLGFEGVSGHHLGGADPELEIDVVGRLLQRQAVRLERASLCPVSSNSSPRSSARPG